MSDPIRLTNERLRSWLNANQPARERLACAVMQLDQRYSSVKPRLPEGGRDGGRDIQAVTRTGSSVFGAVGFRNNAHDSLADKRWAKKKFTDDLESAINADEALRHFVFFTNVNLSPKELQNMEEKAAQRGPSSIEIFTRERLVQALNQPLGLAIRFQFLDIELSKEEQAAFFESRDLLLKNAVDHGFRSLVKSQQRGEFFSRSSKPAKLAFLLIRLKQSFSADKIGSFAVVMRVQSMLVVNSKEPLRVIHLACCDGYGSLGTPDGPRATFGVQQFCWADDVNRSWGLGEGGFGVETQGIRVWTELSESVFDTLDSFDDCAVDFYATTQLHPLIESVGFIVDGYLLAEAKGADLEMQSVSKMLKLPDGLDKRVEREVKEAGNSWIKIGPQSEVPWQIPWFIAFDHSEPRKLPPEATGPVMRIIKST